MVQVSRPLIVKREIPVENSAEMLASLDTALGEYYCNKKDFEKAVSYIPSWMAFLNDFETRFAYGYSPDTAVLTVLKKMYDSRYEAEIIEKFLLRVTECDISLMEIVYAIYKDGKYKNVELAELKSMEKYTALTTK